MLTAHESDLVPVAQSFSSARSRLNELEINLKDDAARTRTIEHIEQQSPIIERELLTQEHELENLKARLEMSESVTAVTQHVLDSIRKEYNLREPENEVDETEQHQITSTSEEIEDGKENEEYPNSSSNEEAATEFYKEKVAINERLVDEESSEEKHTTSSLNEEDKAGEPLTTNFKAFEQHNEIRSTTRSINEEMQQKIEMVENKLQEIRIKSDIEKFSIESRHLIEKIMMIQSMEEPEEILVDEMEQDDEKVKILSQQHSTSSAPNTDNDETLPSPASTNIIDDYQEIEENKIQLNVGNVRKLSISQTRLLSGSDSDLNSLKEAADFYDKQKFELEKNNCASILFKERNISKNTSQLHKSKQYQTFESSSSANSDIGKQEDFAKEIDHLDELDQSVNTAEFKIIPIEEEKQKQQQIELDLISSSEEEAAEAVSTSALTVPLLDELKNSDSSQQLLLDHDEYELESSPRLPTAHSGAQLSSTSWAVQLMTPTNEASSEITAGSFDDVSITTVIERRMSKQSGKTQQQHEEMNQRSSMDISSEADEADEEGQQRRSERHSSYRKNSSTKNEDEDEEEEANRSQLLDTANLLDSDASLEDNDEPVVVYTISTTKKVNEQVTEENTKSSISELKSTLHLDLRTSNAAANQLGDLLGGFNENQSLQNTQVKHASEERDDDEELFDDYEIRKVTATVESSHATPRSTRRCRDFSESPFQNSSNCTGSQFSMSTTSEENLVLRQPLDNAAIHSQSDTSSLNSVNNDETIISTSGENSNNSNAFMSKSLNYLASLVVHSAGDFSKDIADFLKEDEENLQDLSGKMMASDLVNASNESVKQSQSLNFSSATQQNLSARPVVIHSNQRPTDMGELFITRKATSNSFMLKEELQTPTPVENLADGMNGTFFDNRVTSSGEPSLDHVPSAGSENDTGSQHRGGSSNGAISKDEISNESLSSIGGTVSRVVEKIAAEMEKNYIVETSDAAEIAAAMATAILFSSKVKESQSSDELRSDDSEIKSSSFITTTTTTYDSRKYIVFSTQNEQENVSDQITSSSSSEDNKCNVVGTQERSNLSNSAIDNSAFEMSNEEVEREEDEEDIKSTGSSSQRSMIINTDYDDTVEQAELRMKVNVIDKKPTTTTIKLTSSKNYEENIKTGIEADSELIDVDQAYLVCSDQSSSNHSLEKNASISRSESENICMAKPSSLDLAEQIVGNVLEQSLERLVREEEDAEYEDSEKSRLTTNFEQQERLVELIAEQKLDKEMVASVIKECLREKLVDPIVSSSLSQSGDDEDESKEAVATDSSQIDEEVTKLDEKLITLHHTDILTETNQLEYQKMGTTSKKKIQIQFQNGEKVQEPEVLGIHAQMIVMHAISRSMDILITQASSEAAPVNVFEPLMQPPPPVQQQLAVAQQSILKTPSNELSLSSSFSKINNDEEQQLLLLKSSYSPKEVRFASSNFILASDTDSIGSFTATATSSSSMLIEQQNEEFQQKTVQQHVIAEPSDYAFIFSLPQPVLPAAVNISTTITVESSQIIPSNTVIIPSSNETITRSSSEFVEESIDETSANQEETERNQLQAMIMNTNYKNTFTQINEIEKSRGGKNPILPYDDGQHGGSSSIEENEEDETIFACVESSLSVLAPVLLEKISEELNASTNSSLVTSSQIHEENIAVAFVPAVVENAVAVYLVENLIASAVEKKKEEEENQAIKKKFSKKDGCKDEYLGGSDSKKDDDDDDDNSFPKPDSDLNRVFASNIVTTTTTTNTTTTATTTKSSSDSQQTEKNDQICNDLNSCLAPYDNAQLFAITNAYVIDSSPLLSSSFISTSDILPSEIDDNDEDLINADASVILSSSMHSEATFKTAYNANENEEDNILNETLEEDGTIQPNDDSNSTCSFFTAVSSIQHTSGIKSPKKTSETVSEMLIKQRSTSISSSNYVTANEFTPSTNSPLPKTATFSSQNKTNDDQTVVGAFFDSSAMTTSDSFHTALDLLSSKSVSSERGTAPDLATSSLNSSYSGLDHAISGSQYASLNSSFAASSNQTLSNDEDEEDKTIDDGEGEDDRQSVHTLSSIDSTRHNATTSGEDNVQIGQFNVEYFLKNMHSLVVDNDSVKLIGFSKDSPLNNAAEALSSHEVSDENLVSAAEETYSSSDTSHSTLTNNTETLHKPEKRSVLLTTTSPEILDNIKQETLFEENVVVEESVKPTPMTPQSSDSGSGKNGDGDGVSCTSSMLEFERLEAACDDLDDLTGIEQQTTTASTITKSRRVRETEDIYEENEDEISDELDLAPDISASLEEFVLTTGAVAVNVHHPVLNTIYESFEKEINATTSSSDLDVTGTTTTTMTKKIDEEFVLVCDENENLLNDFVVIDDISKIPAAEVDEANAEELSLLKNNEEALTSIFNHVLIDSSSSVSSVIANFSEKRRDSEPFSKPTSLATSINNGVSASATASPLSSVVSTPTAKPKSLSIANTPSSSSDNASPLSLSKSGRLFACASMSSSNSSLKSTDSFENELKPKVKIDDASFFGRRLRDKAAAKSKLAIESEKVNVIEPVIPTASCLLDNNKDMDASQITIKNSVHIDSGQSSMTASLVSTSQLQSPLDNNSCVQQLVSPDSAYSLLSNSHSGYSMFNASYMSDLAANASGSTSSSFIAQQQQQIEMRESTSSGSISGNSKGVKKTSRRQSRTSSSASSSSSTSLNDSKCHQSMHAILNSLSNSTGVKTVFNAEDLPSFRKQVTSPLNLTGSNNPVTSNNSSSSKSNATSPTTDSPMISTNRNVSGVTASAVGGHTHHSSNCYCGGGGGGSSSGAKNNAPVEENNENKNLVIRVFSLDCSKSKCLEERF